MRLLFCLLFLSSVHTARSQGVFVANNNGDWSSASIWTLNSGSDADGIPDSDDQVSISGLTVDITGARACSQITLQGHATLNTVLNIASGGSLTVSGSATLTNAETSTITFNILNDLTIGGDLNINGTANTAGQIALNLGNASTAPTLTVGGSLSFAATASAANNNIIDFFSGRADLNGPIIFSGPTGTIRNIIRCNDDGVGDGKRKVITWSGTIDESDLNQGQFSVLNTSGVLDYTFTYDGVIDQCYLVNGTSNVFGNVVISTSSSKKTYLPANLDVGNTTTSGSVITVSANSTFSDSANTVSNSSGDIFIENLGTYRRVNNSTYSLASFSFDIPSSGNVPIFDFHVSTGQTVDVLTQTGTYPKVIFSGPGTKTIASNFTSKTIPSIALTEGALNISDGVSAIELSGTTGYDGKITISAGTTVDIQSDDLSSWTSAFDISETSTFIYSFNGAQRILELSNGTSAEAYGNLTLSGTGASAIKTVNTGDDINLYGLLKVGALSGGLKDHADLNIQDGASVKLLSNATYTALIDSLGVNNAINYNSTGAITCQRYIQFLAKNYVDFTAPTTTADIESFENSGLLITGLTNSTYPAYSFKNVYFYDETSTANNGTDFVAASNTNETFTQTSGGKVVRSGLRIYAGASSTVTETLSVSGQLFRDSVEYSLSFTNSSGDDDLYDGWNFIGNPFQSTISLSSIYTHNNAAGRIIGGAVTEGFMPTFYVYKKYDNDTNGVTDADTHYGFYNASTGVSSSLDGPNIAPFQGFWVKTKAGSNQSFNFSINESDKRSTSQRFYKASAPELGKFVLNGSGISSAVYIHQFPGASKGKDLNYDVLPFIESGSADSLQLAFLDNGSVLKLWVNAIPEGLSELTLPLYLIDLKGGSRTLKAENFAAMAQSYSCVSLFDRVTKTKYDLKSNPSISFQTSAPYQGHRFDLILANVLPVERINASCPQVADGLMTVKFGDKEDRNYTLWNASANLMDFVGELDKIKLSLAAGTYQLINNKISSSCPQRITDFIIESNPAIELDINTSPAQPNVGEVVEFTNLSTGTNSFIWTFLDDNSTSNAINPIHTFLTPGLNLVKLEGISNNQNCSKAKVYEINVKSGTDLENIENKDDVLLFIKGENLYLEIRDKRMQKGNVEIYTPDGRLIVQEDVQIGENILSLPHYSSVLIVHVSMITNGSSKKLSKRLFR